MCFLFLFKVGDKVGGDVDVDVELDSGLDCGSWCFLVGCLYGCCWFFMFILFFGWEEWKGDDLFVKVRK